MERAMKKHVFTVDDSKTMRAMVSCTLKNAGYEVTEAQNGTEAITLLDGGIRPDVILTDLNMPYMDGFDLLRFLRSKPEFDSVPVLLLTTESDEQDKALGKALGATGWVSKPFNPEKLVQVINRVCP
jgi:two-component system chemotaxis response regulator CheY